MSFLLVSASASNLSACVGLGVSTFGRYEEVRNANSVPLPEKHEFGFEFPTPTRFTDDEIVAMWGEPDERSSFQSCTILAYKRKISFSGLFGLVAVVPVPLLVPSGKSRDRFFLREGVTVGYTSEYSTWKSGVGFACTIIGCGAVAGPMEDADIHAADEARSQWCSVDTEVPVVPGGN